MFNRMYVQEALKHIWSFDNDQRQISGTLVNDQNGAVSLLIHDLFGAEILKTHKKKGWNFYNRINGERFDFAGSAIRKYSSDYHFEDIHSTPDEANNYVQQDDYSTFLMRFVRAFEEAVGLPK